MDTFPPPFFRKGRAGEPEGQAGEPPPKPCKSTRGPLRLTASRGAGARALAGCVCVHTGGFVLKDTVSGTPLCSPPGDKESLLNLRKRRWPLAPSPSPQHPRQVSPLPRLPPGQSLQPARNPSPEVSCCDLWLLIPTRSEPRPAAPALRGECSGHPQAGLRAAGSGQWPAVLQGSEPHLGKLPLPSPLSQGLEPPGGQVRIRVTQLESGVQMVGSWGLSCRQSRPPAPWAAWSSEGDSW